MEKGFSAHDGETKSAYSKGSTANRLALMRQAARERGKEYSNEATTTGWTPTCTCNAGDPQPCTVLDPFAGASTTLLVAAKLGRDSVGIELNPAYVEMGRKRIAGELGMLCEIECDPPP